MDKRIISMMVLFPVLVLLQVLICNHIMLFNIAVPFIFIYFILRLPVGMSKNILFTLAFCMGFCVDIFSDTPGLNSLSCTLLAALKEPVFYAYITRDDKTKFITPCIATIGWQAYSKYMLTTTAIFCFLNFSIEYFTFASIKDILIMTVGSTLLTALLLYGIDNLMSLPLREA